MNIFLRLDSRLTANNSAFIIRHDTPASRFTYRTRTPIRFFKSWTSHPWFETWLYNMQPQPVWAMPVSFASWAIFSICFKKQKGQSARLLICLRPSAVTLKVCLNPISHYPSKSYCSVANNTFSCSPGITRGGYTFGILKCNAADTNPVLVGENFWRL